MSMMRLSEAAAMLGVPFSGPDAEVLRVCTDSRSVQPGDLFIARPGLIDGRNLGNHVLVNCANIIGEPTTVLFRRDDVDMKMP